MSAYKIKQEKCILGIRISTDKISAQVDCFYLLLKMLGYANGNFLTFRKL